MRWTHLHTYLSPRCLSPCQVSISKNAAIFPLFTLVITLKLLLLFGSSRISLWIRYLFCWNVFLERPYPSGKQIWEILQRISCKIFLRSRMMRLDSAHAHTRSLPLAQAIYLTRQHYRKTVPSGVDNNRILLQQEYDTICIMQ
jgi:hypothetical protein